MHMITCKKKFINIDTIVIHKYFRLDLRTSVQTDNGAKECLHKCIPTIFCSTVHVYTKHSRCLLE